VSKLYIVEGLYESYKAPALKYWGMVAFNDYGYGVFKDKAAADLMIAMADISQIGIHPRDKLVKLRIVKQRV
jgi:hypothetical protein